jgi:hypothetical protein
MYEGYLKLKYRYLLDDLYNELTCTRISYGEITYVYKKAHVIVM